MPSISYLSTSIWAISAISASYAMPLKARQISASNYGPIPSETNYYSDYRGKAPPFPANITTPILPTASGPPGPDDLLFQNLLGAEWVVYSFYQAGVELLNASSFTALDLPNTTYDRIQEIRDNEAGHLRIFQDSISNSSIKPGPCKYDFGIDSAEDFLSLQVLIEISSMAFAAGLDMQAKLNATKGALVAIGETETRHGVWAMIDVWGASPFAGAIDTSYPYANQILDSTNRFVIPGSCPSENPAYPTPNQHLPQLSTNTTGTPGSEIVFGYTDLTNVPTFDDGKDYWAVFYHGIDVISAPFDKATNSSIIPAAFEAKGVIFAVIADEEGAPTQETVMAGPDILLQQPAAFGDAL